MIRIRRPDSPAPACTVRSLTALVALVALVAAACGGGSSAAADPAPETTSVATTVAVAVVPTSTSAAAAPPSTVTATSEAPRDITAGSTDLVALGEELFQRTAGGIGCQACHGKDALGDVGPMILGKSAETIKVQLDFNPNMAFIILTDEEVDAIAAYLGVLQAEFDAQMDG